MASRCREFVDSRLRRSPTDRASAVPYGQAGENAMRFPRLAHRSAAAHKLHSTRQQDRMNLISGKGETSRRLPVFSLYSSPEAVQTTGTVAARTGITSNFISVKQRLSRYSDDRKARHGPISEGSTPTCRIL